MIFYIVNPLSAGFIYSNISLVLTFISFLLIPQIGFFLIGSVLSKSELYIKKVYMIIGRIHFFTFLSGIVLFFWRPDFYINYLYVVQSKFYEVETWFYPRLVSYLDTSMILGIVGTFSFVLIYYFETRSRFKYFMLLIVVIGILMTLSRGAWLSLMVSIIFIAMKELKQLNFRPIFFGFITLTIFFFTLVINDYNISILSDFTNRLENIGGTVSERSEQWENIVNQINQYPYGFGLGLTSHKSQGFEHTVPDGNYFRILGDTGILGLFVFILFFLYAIYQAWIKSYPTLIILVAFFIQAIGTNVFDLYYAGYYFWFFLGITFNMPYKS